MKLRPGSFSDRNKEFEENPEMDYFISQEEVALSTQSTMLLPCRKGDLHENFRMGAFEIIEGRNIQSDDHYTAVISTNLAQRNGLSVGDGFTIESKEGMFQPTDDPFKTWGVPITVEIVGIYSINFEQASNAYTSEVEYAENQIYTDLDTGNQMEINRGKESSENRYGDITFFVDDPKNLESIISVIKNMDNLELGDLLLKPDDTAYRASAKPLNQINTFALVLIIAGILGCIMILYLVLNMWTKGRRQEMGILLSIGMKRRTIVFQMICECMVVAVIALTLSFASSGIITEGIFTAAEHMTEPGEAVQEYTAENEGGLSLRINKVSSDAVQLEYHLTVLLAVFVFFAICGISGISVILASSQIMRIKPKNLLQTM